MIRNQWKPIVEATFDVYKFVLNREPKVVVKLVIRPFRASFPNLIDFTSRLDILVHPAADLLQSDIAQLPLDPPVSRFR